MEKFGGGLKAAQAERVNRGDFNPSEPGLTTKNTKDCPAGRLDRALISAADAATASGFCVLCG
jgi:hypothetical protein